MNSTLIWKTGFIILIISIILTILPIIIAFLKKVKLDKPNKWIEESTHLNKYKERLLENENRILGTLKYWKNQANAHKRLHKSNIFWGIISSVSLPVLIQYYDSTNIWSQIFMTVLTFWTGAIFAISHTLKAEEKYQGFRATESEYYDITRELLDTSEIDSFKLEQIVYKYFEDVEKIRKVARNIETESPPSSRI